MVGKSLFAYILHSLYKKKNQSWVEPKVAILNHKGFQWSAGKIFTRLCEVHARHSGLLLDLLRNVQRVYINELHHLKKKWCWGIFLSSSSFLLSMLGMEPRAFSMLVSPLPLNYYISAGIYRHSYFIYLFFYQFQVFWSVLTKFQHNTKH